MKNKSIVLGLILLGSVGIEISGKCIQSEITFLAVADDNNCCEKYKHSTAVTEHQCELTTGCVHGNAALASHDERSSSTRPKKNWTILVYIAADNNLYPFAYRNLAQMKQIGSNDNVNILVHLDIKHPEQPKVTRHLYIEQNKIWQIGNDECLDSGSDITLFNALSWAMNDFPSEHFALVLWNHGSGPLNPVLKGGINPAQLFKYNPETHLIELDRSVHFMDFLEEHYNHAEPRNNPYLEHEIDRYRGVCFDDTNGTYLDDAKLIRAFTKILQHRNNKKIDLIIFDACLMAGVEIADIVSPFAHFMVGSQEVVLGTGYDYQDILKALASQNISPDSFARQIVASYYKTYGTQTNDYTNSAVNLEKLDVLLENLNQLSQLLIEALKKQTKNSVRQIIKKSRDQRYCVAFDEPSYIDIKNFYRNLLQSIDQITLNNTQDTKNIISQIKEVLARGIDILDKIVLVHIEGKNLAGAGGLSIHFPERNFNSPTYQSYYSTKFALGNSWSDFLKEYFGK